MSIKDRIIKRLEHDVESTAGYIDFPELFDDKNPEIYYHEEIHDSYKPFGFDFEKRLLSYLRGDSKALPSRKQFRKYKKRKFILGT